MKRNHAERQAADESRTGRFYPKQAVDSALSLDEQIRTARIRLAVATKPFYSTRDLFLLGFVGSRNSANRLARLLSKMPFKAQCVVGMIPDRVWRYAGTTRDEAVASIARTLASLEAAKEKEE